MDQLEVYVKAFPVIRDFVSLKLSNGSRLRDLIDLLAGRYDEFRDNFLSGGRLDTGVVIMVNNNIVRDMDYVLREGDRIVIIPPVAGGCEST